MRHTVESSVHSMQGQVPSECRIMLWPTWSLLGLCHQLVETVLSGVWQRPQHREEVTSRHQPQLGVNAGDLGRETAFPAAATMLVGGLASENVRWAESVESFKNQGITLCGDVLLISAFVSYVGYFTKKYRNELMEKFWIPYIHNLKVPIPITNGLDPLSLLTDDADVATWNNQGLPSDRMSTENATILCNTERWPLIVDAQLQGIKWIKNKYGSELKAIRLGQKSYLDVIEQAISEGDTLLIENIGETVDPVLDPLLGRNTIKKGKGNAQRFLCCLVSSRGFDKMPAGGKEPQLLRKGCKEVPHPNYEYPHQRFIRDHSVQPEGRKPRCKDEPDLPPPHRGKSRCISQKGLCPRPGRRNRRGEEHCSSGSRRRVGGGSLVGVKGGLCLRRPLTLPPPPTRYIKIGDKEVEYHPKFRLILHTKYFNPHYKPEMQAQCTLINFLVTRDGLEDQLLAAVVAKERPDLEQLKGLRFCCPFQALTSFLLLKSGPEGGPGSVVPTAPPSLQANLTKSQNEFKIVLKELEDSLLARLSAASGNFLGDTALVENLETTKHTAIEIEEKVRAASAMRPGCRGHGRLGGGPSAPPPSAGRKAASVIGARVGPGQEKGPGLPSSTQLPLRALGCLPREPGWWLGMSPPAHGTARLLMALPVCYIVHASFVCVKVVEAKITEVKINEARENYRPAAERASLLYFILNDLNKINPIYQFSLKVGSAAGAGAALKVGLHLGSTARPVACTAIGQYQATLRGQTWSSLQMGLEGGARGPHLSSAHSPQERAFNVVFEKAIQRTTPASNVKQRVTNLTDEITYSIYMYTARGLFERDKLIFLAQVAFQGRKQSLQAQRMFCLTKERIKLRKKLSMGSDKRPFGHLTEEMAVAITPAPSYLLPI
ncbi:hypothetical protein P7K49_011926 [Saguinus oedipus]|uniref:Dynein heavy chain ATP-binding dynein motor region domain-containing protein n=1 Tax=Saguinus oedipus TaxID=9490 RepID=A0ABQ9VTK9_SAGOE|nr:hypothetical protein P7K49_011926 [Saguinus oedipus]